MTVAPSRVINLVECVSLQGPYLSFHINGVEAFTLTEPVARELANMLLTGATWCEGMSLQLPVQNAPTSAAIQ